MNIYPENEQICNCTQIEIAFEKDTGATETKKVNSSSPHFKTLNPPFIQDQWLEMGEQEGQTDFRENGDSFSREFNGFSFKFEIPQSDTRCERRLIAKAATFNEHEFTQERSDTPLSRKRTTQSRQKLSDPQLILDIKEGKRLNLADKPDGINVPDERP